MDWTCDSLLDLVHSGSQTFFSWDPPLYERLLFTTLNNAHFYTNSIEDMAFGL